MEHTGSKVLKKELQGDITVWYSIIFRSTLEYFKSYFSLTATIDELNTVLI